MWFTVRDNITKETIQLSTLFDAETEAERRVTVHHTRGIDAVIIENGKDIIVCNQSEL